MENRIFDDFIPTADIRTRSKKWSYEEKVTFVVTKLTHGDAFRFYHDDINRVKSLENALKMAIEIVDRSPIVETEKKKETKPTNHKELLLILKETEHLVEQAKLCLYNPHKIEPVSKKQFKYFISEIRKILNDNDINKHL